jgi:hypothetical protein
MHPVEKEAQKCALLLQFLKIAIAPWALLPNLVTLDEQTVSAQFPFKMAAQELKFSDTIFSSAFLFIATFFLVRIKGLVVVLSRALQCA